MHQTYKGKFKPKHPEKYQGTMPIIYRSGWELRLMSWLDSNQKIISWGSESVVVPYVCATDNRPHRYFVDFLIKYCDGRIFLVELKPENQTKVPTRGKKRQATVITETLSYAKNLSKWNAAAAYAEKQGWIFQIWTEKTLKNLGIPVC